MLAASSHSKLKRAREYLIYSIWYSVQVKTCPLQSAKQDSQVLKPHPQGCDVPRCSQAVISLLVRAQDYLEIQPLVAIANSLFDVWQKELAWWGMPVSNVEMTLGDLRACLVQATSHENLELEIASRFTDRTWGCWVTEIHR